MMLKEYLEVSARQYEERASSAPNDYIKGLCEGRALAYREILAMLNNISDFVVDVEKLCEP